MSRPRQLFDGAPKENSKLLSRSVGRLKASDAGFGLPTLALTRSAYSEFLDSPFLRGL